MSASSEPIVQVLHSERLTSGHSGAAFCWSTGTSMPSVVVVIAVPSVIAGVTGTAHCACVEVAGGPAPDSVCARSPRTGE